MRERIYRSDAIILRRSDFSESDRLLLLATPGGKRRVIAKGVRKTTSRLAGHIELFTHARLMLAKGRNLDIITQSQIMHSYGTLRGDLGRLSCAYYAAELYDKFTQEEEENRTLFTLLVDTFGALDTYTNPDLVLRAFELRLLHNTGYRPHLHYCAVSQVKLTEDADRFSPSLGGVLSAEHTQADPQALPMSATAFRLLRYLQSQPFTVVGQMNLSASVRTEVNQLLRAYIRHLLERDLKSVAFLEDVMRDEQINRANYDVHE